MILERQLEDPVIDERVRDENAELCSEVSSYIYRACVID